VSHLSLRHRAVTDGPWGKAIGRIVQQCGAPVLPVFFEGRNSLTFQALGLLHPRLRTVMLPRELLARQHSRLRVRIGNVIPAARLARLEDPSAAASYLRVRTYLLKGRRDGVKTESTLLPPPRSHGGGREAPAAKALQQIAEAERPDRMAAEVHMLLPQRALARAGQLCVVHATAKEIPSTLREIGRLREITFRAAGEGTGRERDLDSFDDYYRHLFVWHEGRREVVGAYRMGLSEEIIGRLGPRGLYTHTLFRYGPELLRQIGPALELGRSFVRREYQKEYAPLLLLWKGIAGFVAAHPQYKMLLGPVSISNDYQSLTKQLLVWFLRLNRYLPNLGRLIHPRNPATSKHLRPPRDLEAALAATAVTDIDEVDELVAEVEAARHGGVPVLLRQYLKLNAKLLGFNVDPQFGEVLDALMLVDLTQVPRAALARYMGAGEAERFYSWHGRPA
jgi:putative hemolysin